jgi:uncharacterized protein (TIGR02145 family)
VIQVRRGEGGDWAALASDGKLVLQTSMTWEAKAVRGNRESAVSSASFQFPVIKGQFTDSRDGRVYKTVKIGGLVWMAENLKWIPDSANWNCMNSQTSGCSSLPQVNWKCLNNDTANCDKFGPLYGETFVSLADSNSFHGVAWTVCPSGWHLSHITEWDSLIAEVGGASVAGTELKSKTDWDGTDEFGFNALRGGWYVNHGFTDGGASWHFQESKNDGSHYYQGYVEANDGLGPFGVGWEGYMTLDGFRSVRCVQDSL